MSHFLKRIYHRLAESAARTKNRMAGVSIGTSCKVRRASFGTCVTLGDYCNVNNSVIGDYSYLGDRCEMPLADIGPFCSIARGVTLAAGAHPKDWVSTSPMTYLGSDKHNYGALFPTCSWGGEYAFLDSDKRVVIEVGADCWIGTNAVLVASSKPLRIGVGAIIAAGSVVTKDVRPYSIVAGVPAGEIGRRFNESISQRLLESRWWELPPSKINAFMDDMDAAEEFLEHFDK